MAGFRALISADVTTTSLNNPPDIIYAVFTA